MSGSLDFRILGSLEVRQSGRIVQIPHGKQQTLLAALLLNANDVVPADSLIDQLWGLDAPETARNNLQVYVSRLRRALEPERTPGEPWRVLVRHPRGYALRVEPDQIDAGRFERLLGEAREDLPRGESESAVAKLRSALALWRGAPLADFVDEPFAQVEIARLEELRLAALEERIDADLALGRHEVLVGELESLVALHPVRERLRAQLMLALYRCGRQAEALQVYRDARRTLIESFGLEPGPTLQELERAILVQDPALALTAMTAAGEEVRKPITVLVVEVTGKGVGDTPLDPEAQHRLLLRALEVVADAVEQHGGAAEKTVGTVVAGLFGLPVVQEDDALRAVRAAAEARERLGELGDELERSWGVTVEARVAINTGEVVAAHEPSGPLPLGGEVANLALHLVHAAAPGEILLGDTTEPLVRDAARLEAVIDKPLARAWRLLDVSSVAPPVRRSLDAPLFGREDELADLLQAYERAVDTRLCHVFTVLGSPGIGKSRLGRELFSLVHDQATVLAGRCWPHGEGVTFWPVAQIVREAAGGTNRQAIVRLLAGEVDADAVAERVTRAIGVSGGSGTPEETFWATRRLLEAVARERPLVVLIDDLQWAEPMLLDLIEHLTDRARGVPIFLLCLARPELLEHRPGWGEGKLNANSLSLEPLARAACRRLIESRVEPDEPPEETRAAIIEAAGGNPLFVEQLLAKAREEGWSPSDEELPPRLHTLLAARLDRLEQEERQVIARAALVGQDFARDAVAALLPAEAVGELDLCLDALVRNELIQPQRPAGEGAFRFRHLLIRDAAYQSIPKETRGELHGRFAAWLEREAGGSLPQIDEILGHHLEQAYRYRAELGPLDEQGRALAARGAEKLAAAGARALARGDMRAATTLLSRAYSLGIPDETARLDLLLKLGEALRDAGEFDRAGAVTTEALELGVALGDRVREHDARLARARLDIHADPEMTVDRLFDVAREAVDVFEEASAHGPLARGWAMLAWVSWNRLRAGEAAEAWQRSIESARLAGDERAEAQSLAQFLAASLFGPFPVDEGIRLCERILAERDERDRATPSAFRALGGFKAMAGSFDEARRCLERDRALVNELGLPIALVSSAEVSGLVEMLAGDPAAAERWYRWAFEYLEQMGEHSGLAVFAADVAQALCGQGRYEEALDFTQVGESGLVGDLQTRIQLDSTAAKAMAKLGRLDEAECLGRESVALVAQTDLTNIHADALCDFAEVLRLAGKEGEASSAVEQAARLYEQRGNVVAAGRARELLAGSRR